MGHAGAIISGSKDRASNKIAVMEDAGVTVVKALGEFSQTVEGISARANLTNKPHIKEAPYGPLFFAHGISSWFRSKLTAKNYSTASNQ